MPPDPETAVRTADACGEKTNAPSRTQLIERFAKECTVQGQLEAWTWLELDPDWRIADPTKSDAIISQMREEYGDETLLQCRFLRLGKQGVISVAPVFSKEPSGRNAIGIVRNPSGSAVDLVTEVGTLSGQPSLRAFGYDPATQAAFQRCRKKAVNVVFSMIDLALFRAVQLPVVLADRLENLSPEFLSELVYWTSGSGSPVLPPRPVNRLSIWGTNGSRFSALADNHEPCFQLRIHAWSPTAEGDGLTAFPGGLDRLLRGLDLASRMFGFVWKRLSVVTPAPVMRNALEYARIHRSAALLRECLLGTIAENKALRFYAPRKLIGRPAAPPAPHPFLRARDALTAAQRREEQIGGADDRAKIWRAYHKAFDQQIVRPLIERALTESDPCAQSLGLLIASLTQIAEHDAQHVRDLEAQFFVPMHLEDRERLKQSLPDATRQLQSSMNLLLRALAHGARRERDPSRPIGRDRVLTPHELMRAMRDMT